MTKITIGSDPELHLQDNETGKIVSAIPILKKDKHNPIVLSGGTKLYYDNVLAEISHSPVANAEDGVKKFREIFSNVQKFLGPRYTLLPQAAHTYDKDQLKDKTCWETGCNPNLDAYAEMENPRVEFKDGLRTGSFHIHLGHPKLKTMYEKADAIKMMDVYLGCSSVIFDKDPTAGKRRKYYGRAGEFRPTDYGLEYRPLGNYPLRTPAMTKLVFDLVEYCAGHVERGTVKDVINIKGIQKVTQWAINDNDPKEAMKVLDKAALPHALLERVKQTYEVPAFREAWGL